MAGSSSTFLTPIRIAVLVITFGMVGAGSARAAIIAHSGSYLSSELSSVSDLTSITSVPNSVFDQESVIDHEKTLGSPTPEPTTLILTGSVLVAIGCLRRRSR
jgi:hypothetical protein